LLVSKSLNGQEPNQDCCSLNIRDQIAITIRGKYESLIGDNITPLFPTLRC
jgi:hypothetical protein